MCQFTPLRHHIFYPKKATFLVQDFPAQKAFISWRSAGRRGRMAKAGKAVGERVFQLHLWFRALENDESSKTSKECSKKKWSCSLCLLLPKCKSCFFLIFSRSFVAVRLFSIVFHYFPLFFHGFPWFSMCFWGNTYLTMRRMFQDFANVRILRSYFAQPQTLAEFQVAQENWQHDLFQRAQQQAQKVRSDARRWKVMAWIGWDLMVFGIWWNSQLFPCLLHSIFIHFPTYFGIFVNFLEVLPSFSHRSADFLSHQEVFGMFVQVVESVPSVYEGFFGGQMRHEKSLGGRLY